MLRLSSPRRLAVLLALTAAGCGRDHNLGAGGGGASSTSNSTTTSVVSSSAGTGGAPSSSSSGAGGAGGDPEPAGTIKLTVVNGVVDYPAVRLCFLPGDTPWPASASGLAFAGSQVVASLASAIPIDGDVTPWVIAGDLTQTAGKTCAQILALAAPGDAGPQPVIARPLAVIPKVVWSSNKSLLLVPNGCLGGPGHDDANGKLACGNGYTSTSPTAGVALVSMSRIADAGHVSLQVVGASTALPEVDVGVLPNLTDAMPKVFAATVSQGAIVPKPPFSGLTVAELGPLDGVQIQTFTPSSTLMSSAVPLSKIFANGGPGAPAVVNGARLVLVAVGAGPGLATASWWHELTYALVAADP
ncbi:MAG: hypothetical protein QM820_16625 [Minicystis sp.]